MSREIRPGLETMSGKGPTFSAGARSRKGRNLSGGCSCPWGFEAQLQLHDSAKRSNRFQTQVLFLILHLSVGDALASDTAAYLPSTTQFLSAYSMPGTIPVLGDRTLNRFLNCEGLHFRW
jgi:hypothetical protein